MTTPSARLAFGPGSPGRDAFTAVEVVIAILILVAGLIPMYFLFTGTQVSVFRSRVSYMALHAAREELEALRQVPPNKLINMRHDWEPLTGSVLRRVTAPDSAGATVATSAGPGLEYPKDYARIETKVEVSSNAEADADIPQSTHPRLYHVLLQVRWQEMGKSEEEGGAGHRSALSRFHTVIADHRVR
ncbi:MAG: hypothetical protein HY814_11750 [Candidatus Riflebacteria bacterium]|nr:hypothetical protein [Candidatus Riflebacteria bacterium]